MQIKPLHDRVVVRRLDVPRRPVASLSPTLPKKSPCRAKLSRSDQVVATKVASGSSLTSRPVTRCCSASGPAPRSLIMKESDIMGIIEGSAAAKAA